MISAMQILERGVGTETMDAIHKVLHRYEKSTAEGGYPVLFTCCVRVNAITREQEPIRWKAQKIIRVRHTIRAWGPLSEPFHAYRYAKRSGS